MNQIMLLHTIENVLIFGNLSSFLSFCRMPTHICEMAVNHGFELFGQPSYLPCKVKTGEKETGSSLYTFKLKRYNNPSLLEKYTDPGCSEPLRLLMSGLDNTVSAAYKKRIRDDLKTAKAWADTGRKIKDELLEEVVQSAQEGIPCEHVEWHNVLSCPNLSKKAKLHFESRSNDATVNQLQDIALDAYQVRIINANVTALYWEKYLQAEGVSIKNEKCFKKKCDLAIKLGASVNLTNKQSHMSLSSNILQYKKDLNEPQEVNKVPVIPDMSEMVQSTKRQKIH